MHEIHEYDQVGARKPLTKIYGKNWLHFHNGASAYYMSRVGTN
jgi:hypothetical protein